MDNLTKIQRELYEFLRDCAGQGEPLPTYRELCAKFGWASTGTVRDHLRALVRKGYVELTGKHRRFKFRQEHPGVSRVPLVKRQETRFTGFDDAKLKGRAGAIVMALRRCMLTRGYAETSLTDLAKSAGISVPHLLYYYPSKDAVLRKLCAEVVDRMVAEVTSCRDDPPDERIHMLVDHVFVPDLVARSERAMLLELNALAIHRPEIRKKLSQSGRDIRAYLTDLFSKVPRQPGLSAEDAAEIALSFWTGIFSNSYYDASLNEGRARRLFRRTLFSLANIPNAYSQAEAAKPFRRRRDSRREGASLPARLSRLPRKSRVATSLAGSQALQL